MPETPVAPARIGNAEKRPAFDPAEDAIVGRDAVKAAWIMARKARL